MKRAGPGGGVVGGAVTLATCLLNETAVEARRRSERIGPTSLNRLGFARRLPLPGIDTLDESLEPSQILSR